MKLEDCYSTLGLSPNANDDETKKKYKELSKQWHPDINKSPEADAKFKKINEAYDRIKNKNFEQDAPAQGGFGGFGGFNINLEDFLNMTGFGGSRNSQKIRNFPPIETSVVISFKESVFGCKKELSFKRNVKCESCDGEGKKAKNNNCTSCNGLGKTITQKGNMVFTSTCGKCKGKVSFESCNDCSQEGTKQTTTTISVNVPAGISNDTLRLSGIGHFIGNQPFGHTHTDVYVHVRVIPESNFYLEDGDVISKISVSLLDAIKGCTKEVDTLDGNRSITIPALSKNKEEIKIPGLGVGRRGCQRVILNVEYPSNTEALLSTLKEIS